MGRDTDPVYARRGMTPHDPSPLVGLAVGDALGMPFETASKFETALLSWDGESYGSSSYHRLGPGQWTDDTMMSVCLAESLCGLGSFDPAHVAKRYVDWYRTGDRRGMGRSTEEALARLSRGTTWDKSGARNAEGNGTAMRAGILGAYFKQTPQAAADFARTDANITHASREAEEGSAAVAYATALLANGAAKNEALLDSLLLALRGSAVRRSIEALRPLLQHRVNVEDILGIEVPTGAHVVQTVPAALASFLLTDSYEACVRAAIRAGGDTDTTAAIAGGLAGTHYGFGAIPARWRRELERGEALRVLEVSVLNHPH